MKILFIGDASNFHNCLANALRDMGHNCMVISDGSTWQKTECDIRLIRKKGTINAFKYLFQTLKLLPKLKGFDIVHFINPPVFLSFRPFNLFPFLFYVKAFNKFLFLSALGTDKTYVNACYDKKTFRYSDYFVGDNLNPYMKSIESYLEKNWNKTEVNYFHNFFIKNMDGIVSCLYEYHIPYINKFPNKTIYGGIPIDTKSIHPNYIETEPQKVRFFIGIQKNKIILKGADKLLETLKKICSKYPDKAEMTVVENVPYSKYLNIMREHHVILDQLYSYSPCTNALLGMAQGLIAVSGAEPEYYDFIGETENKPIINVSPLIENDIYNKLEWIILNKSKLPELSRASRAFVEKHNDSHIVAQRHLDFWNKFLQK